MNLEFQTSNLSYTALGLFRMMSREELRELARKHNIMRGRNTHDTIHNLNRGLTRLGYIAKFNITITATFDESPS